MRKQVRPASSEQATAISRLGWIYADRLDSPPETAFQPKNPSGRLRRSQRNARKIAEPRGVRGHDDPIGGKCRRGDDEVVCAAWTSGDARIGEQAGVETSDLQVVYLDRDRREYVRHIPFAAAPAAAIGELDSDEELGCGDRRHRNVVVVCDHLVERRASALGLYEDRRIDDQSVQRRSSTRNSNETRGDCRHLDEYRVSSEKTLPCPSVQECPLRRSLGPCFQLMASFIDSRPAAAEMRARTATIAADGRCSIPVRWRVVHRGTE